MVDELKFKDVREVLDYLSRLRSRLDGMFIHWFGSAVARASRGEPKAEEQQGAEE